MKEFIQQNILSGWSFMRVLRLAVGIFFVVQAVQIQQTLMGLVGLFFALTALLNTGCCGVRTCNPRMAEKDGGEIVYEEITNK